MEAIFDKHANPVAWLQVGSGYIFSLEMKYIAFTRFNGLFSPQCDRLGYYMDGVFRDNRKRVVAFLVGAHTDSKVPDILPPPHPQKPAKPAIPRKPSPPTHPSMPHGNFSPIDWNEMVDFS